MKKNEKKRERVDGLLYDYQESGRLGYGGMGDSQWDCHNYCYYSGSK
jgi:hypothetical protein